MTSIKQREEKKHSTTWLRKIQCLSGEREREHDDKIAGKSTNVAEENLAPLLRPGAAQLRRKCLITEETVQQGFKAKRERFVKGFNVHPSLLVYLQLLLYLHIYEVRRLFCMSGIITTQGKQCAEGWIFTIR